MAINSWLASCAAFSQSGTTIDRWNPADTSHPLWAQRFSEFNGVGAFTTGTTTAASVTKTINRFVPGEPWRVDGYNTTYNGDYARIDMEFMAGASVVLAVSIRDPVAFKNVIHVGNTVGTLAAKPSFGTYPSVGGILVADVDGIRYTPREGSDADTTAFFHAKDLSSVNAVRFTARAYTGYTAVLQLCAHARVEIMGRLRGVVKDASDAPAARLVRAVREDTGAYMGSATSDATTGGYSIATDYSGAHTLLAYPAAGENLPALALRGVTPL